MRREDKKRRPHVVTVYAHDGAGEEHGPQDEKQERGSRGRKEPAGEQEEVLQWYRDDWEANSFKYQGEESGLNC